MPKDSKKPPAYNPTVEDSPEAPATYAQPEPGSRFKTTWPIPVIGGGVAVIALSVAAIVFFAASESPLPASDTMVDAAFNPLHDSQVQLTSDFISEQITEGTQAVEQQLREPIESLAAEIEPLRRQLTESRLKTTSLEEKLEQFIARMDSTVASIETREQRHAARHLALDTAKPAKKAITEVQLEPQRKQKPPFRLAAVEYWDREPVALVLLNGRKRSLKVGDAVMTYKVVELSVPERTLSLYEATTGKHYMLEAGTNYVTEIRSTTLEDPQ